VGTQTESQITPITLHGRTNPTSMGGLVETHMGSNPVRTSMDEEIQDRVVTVVKKT
jgi:hypothetical protein